jgi:uncharacterized protein (TIGR02246 family)
MPLALGVLIAACSPAADQSAQEATETTTEEYASPAAAGELIAALAANYAENYNLGHASTVADMYTDDAIVQGSTSAISVGREAIAADVEVFMTAMSPALSISPTEQLTVGDWVVDRGSYTNEVTPDGSEAVTLTGNYMSLSKRTDGGVLMHRLTVNFDAPPTMPMPVPELAEFEPLTDAPTADLTSSWEENYNAGDAAVVAAHYSDDAVVMFSERPLVSGRGAIEAVLAGAIEETSPTIGIMLAESLMLGDGWLLNRGSFTIDATIEGQSVTRHGTFMTVLRQTDDGSWKIHWGISNAAPLTTM